ncbi:MAG: RluA family pseudouridine synthase [Clostridiales bacterium]|nr:RluA family pseudouridine synthase [Clostridiales bacterium]
MLEDVFLTIESPQESGERLDRFVCAHLPDLSRSAVQRLIDEGLVTVNGKAPGKSYKLRENDAVVVRLPDPKPAEVLPQAIPLDIVYEDVDLLVVNKPKGMVVHPAPGNPDGTLVNALLAHCGESLSGIGGVLRPGIVHRIDKDTSGLLMVAKNDFAHQSLARQIAEHSFTRRYEAVVYGRMKEQSGTVDAPIGRHPVDRKRMAVARTGGREARTHFETLHVYRDFSHLRLQLETGRTHQIRVHMASLGHPVAGDPVYGPKKVMERLKGQCLHAREIGFAHPRDNRWMQFTSPLPDYFVRFLRSLSD